MPYNHIGIDFGAKVAGTTVICHYDKNKKFNFYQSNKGKNADEFIKKKIEEIQPPVIFIDAPLSLPGIYYHSGNGHQDYFYRKADQEVGGMSPMFIGGVTARAIKLKNELSLKNFNFIEVYPKKLKQIIFPENQNYKTSFAALSIFMEELYQHFQKEEFVHAPENWHQLDSLLAWWSGKRYFDGIAESFGDKEEGLIYI